MYGRDRAGNRVVEAETRRLRGRQNHLARRHSESDSGAGGELPVRRQQRAAIERKLDEPARRVGPDDARVEYAAKSDRLAQPGQVWTAGQLAKRSTGDSAALLDDEKVRCQTDDVVEIVSHQDKRH